MGAMDRSHLLTELRLPESMTLDAMSAEQAVALMHQQDLVAVEAVGRVQKDVARAVDLIVEGLRRGGRLIYVGAGTSGRLGVLDASECPPTFRTDPNMVQGVIAGGDAAMFRAQEGAEDSAEHGGIAVEHKYVTANDVVCGIAAGGTTPFVWGALRKARELAARTIFLSCVQPVPGEPEVDVTLRPLTGPEVVTGSTRLKAGTATKLILNMLTTVSMVRLGKTYENLMVDLRATNAKLRDRAIRIISTVTGLAADEARGWLERAGGHVKLAILMQKRNVSADEGERLLAKSGGSLREAMGA
jgi:N-acetylmuramic acid 6-phosphate etherase